MLCCGALFQGAVAAQPASFRVVKDVQYQNAEPGERADIYLPMNATAKVPRPLVIWMHGSDHDKADARERNVCSNLATEGYIAVSINYGGWPATDAGEQHSPRILQNIVNARNAVRYFRAHDAEYGIDPAHIALFGGSAGAWLALMAGLTHGDPAVDSSQPYPGVSSAVSAIGDFYSDVDGWMKSRITANSPPVLIVQGKADPAVDYRQSVDLDRALAAAHVPQEMLLLDGVGHAFDLTTWKNKPLPEDLRPVVFAFLKRYLGAPPQNAANATGQ